MTSSRGIWSPFQTGPFLQLIACVALPLAAGAQETKKNFAAPGESGLETFPRWTISRLAGTGSPPLLCRTVPAFPNLFFSQPLGMVRVPGSGGAERFVILEQQGGLWTIENDEETSQRELMLRLGDEQAAIQPQNRMALRLIAMTFHCDYPEIPLIFVSYNRRDGERAFNRVSRFQVISQDPPRADAASEAVLLEWESNGHNGGDLKFGPDGFLYISTGDGSTPGDPENVGQTVDNLLGSILRIDVNHAGGGRHYAVPPDNPFAGIEGVRPEIWAYGLRNPWRMNFHPERGELWLGDNGDEHWEMVHWVRKGANFGWSAFEGSHPFRLSNKLAGPTPVQTPPVVEHPHTEMRSVIGGLFYRGQKLKGFRGSYLYGCHFTRKIWAVSWDGKSPGTPQRIAGTGHQVVSFAEDAAGEVYIVTLDGPVLRLEEAPSLQTEKPIPRQLSATGLFASTAEHRVAEGVLPYDINAPAWSDGAERGRYFALPPDGQIQVQPQSPGLKSLDLKESRGSTAGMDRWRFPDGAALLQTLSLKHSAGGKRIETQVMHKDGGEWKFLTYRWNEDQSDAVLVPENGETIEIDDRSAPGNGQSWRFMARAECAACHTQRSFFSLGMNIAQLNREFDYSAWGGGKGNQLATFARLGLFQSRLARTGDAWPRFVHPDNRKALLDDRARAYLHVNCAHCHRETGLGGRAEFQLLHWLTLEETGIVNALPLVGLPGVADARVLFPGHPERSEIYRRMATRDTGKMPLIGSERVDAQGLELIRQWIESMAAAE